VIVNKEKIIVFLFIRKYSLSLITLLIVTLLRPDVNKRRKMGALFYELFYEKKKEISKELDIVAKVY